MVKQNVYICRVEDIDNEKAWVTILNRATGNRFQATCAALALARYGIGNRDEFMCVVGKKNVLKFRRLKRRPISEEQMKAIQAEVDGVLK